jgi:hypothetical protein
VAFLAGKVQAISGRNSAGGVLWKSPEFFQGRGPTEFYEMLSAIRRQRIRGYPPPPRSNWIIDLEENHQVIYGRQ